MKDISDAIKTRVILETGAVKEVVHNMTPDVIAYLEESIVQREYVQLSHKNSFEKWWKNNTDFHIKISSCAGNTLLTNMVRKTQKEMCP